MVSSCAVLSIFVQIVKRLLFKPGAPGLLELPPSANVGMPACVCVCPPPRLLIISGVMWCDIDPI